MERITNVSQLNKGDVIVNVKGDVITVLEFREIHPHNDAYSVMLNSNQDGAPKFYNKRLEAEEWYLYTSAKQWSEFHQMVIDNLNKEIEHHKERIKKFEGWYGSSNKR